MWHPDRRLVAPGPDAPEEFLLDNGVPFVLWGYSDAAAAFPDGVETLSGAELRRLVLARTDGWAPALRDLIDGSDPRTVNAFRVRSATPVDAWPTTSVTLLGDAIHNMTPMAGIGANTALRDAELLCRRLGEVAAGRSALLPALQDYERRMLDYGFAAVKQSLRNARQAGSGSRLGRAAFRTMMRVTGAVPPLRRRMAAQLGR